VGCLVELARGLFFDPVGEDSGLASFVAVQGFCEEEKGCWETVWGEGGTSFGQLTGPVDGRADGRSSSGEA